MSVLLNIMTQAEFIGLIFLVMGMWVAVGCLIHSGCCTWRYGLVLTAVALIVGIGLPLMDYVECENDQDANETQEEQICGMCESKVRICPECGQEIVDK